MFTTARRVTASSSIRAFSTSARVADLSKLTLIGRLGKDPELRTTKNDKEYVSYTVATTNYPLPPLNADGTRAQPGTTWHHVLSFNPGQNQYLRNLQKGSKVYVEANFELREPAPDAEPDSPQGQRQIFLRHETLRLIERPKNHSENPENPE